jgi:Family of unknown function (DUF6074)
MSMPARKHERAAPPAAPVNRHGGGGGGPPIGPKSAEIVPFPAQRQLGWIRRITADASGRSSKAWAVNCVQKEIDRRCRYMRALGLTKEEIDRDLNPVCSMFENWLRSNTTWDRRA